MRGCCHVNSSFNHIVVALITCHSLCKCAYPLSWVFTDYNQIVTCQNISLGFYGTHMKYSASQRSYL